MSASSSLRNNQQSTTRQQQFQRQRRRSMSPYASSTAATTPNNIIIGSGGVTATTSSSTASTSTRLRTNSAELGPIPPAIVALQRSPPHSSSTETDVDAMLAKLPEQLEAMQLRQRTIFLSKLRPRVPLSRRPRSGPRKGEKQKKKTRKTKTNQNSLININILFFFFCFHLQLFCCFKIFDLKY